MASEQAGHVFSFIANGDLSAKQYHLVQPTTIAVTQYRIGIALEAMASGTTGLITMLITHEGRGSSGN